MKLSDERVMKQYQKFKKKFAEMFSSYNSIRINQETYKYIDYMANNSIVQELIGKYSRDADFKNEVKQSRPET